MTKKQKDIDRRVDAAYRARCSEIAVKMLDIPKIFEVGRKAIAEGAGDVTLANVIYDYVQTIKLD